MSIGGGGVEGCAISSPPFTGCCGLGVGIVDEL